MGRCDEWGEANHRGMPGMCYSSEPHIPTTHLTIKLHPTLICTFLLYIKATPIPDTLPLLRIPPPINSSLTH